jgi:hypothetical protein
MSDPKDAEAFLKKWSKDHVELVNRSDDQQEASRLVRACLEEAYRQRISGSELMAACASISNGGKLNAYMLKQIEDYPFADYLKANA